MKKEKLFKEFPPVSTEEWINKIEKDLKGKPFEKLIKKTEEGFNIKPFYREQDIRNINHTANMPGEFPYIRGEKISENNWLLRQDLTVKNIKEANKKALDISLKGIDALGFVFPENMLPDTDDLELLLTNIRADILELNFSGGEPEKIVKSVDKLAKKYNRSLEKIKGSVNYDPLGFYSLHGHFKNGERQDFNTMFSLFEAGKHLPAFQLITVNAHIFHNAGGSIVSELAYALAIGTAYMTYLTDNGISADEAAQKIRFHFAIGSEYFMEIAKFRAFRYLWSKVVNAYGIKNIQKAAATIHASGSYWNKTVYDPYVNMLRSTTETMSAIISGVDSITVFPFDNTYATPDDFSERIARNQSLILKEESYFGKVNDPAAGSYYIENLTEELITYGWKLFLETDKKGGYLHLFKNGEIQNKIKKEAKIKDMDIAFGKKAVLGVNKYPNFTEHLKKLENESVLFPKNINTDKQETEPLTIYRGAMAFEQLRYKTDKYSLHKPRPKVWMFTYGNLAMRRARSQFASNFFGVAGFEIIDNKGFETIEQGIKKALKDKPDIVVLCASDEDYKTLALQAFKALKNNFIVILAGYPEEIREKLQKEGFNNFIHAKSNLLEELKKYQNMLGI